MSATPPAPLVSIVTPVYNHDEYIEDCITTVLHQTYPHWEQIIIDDGSTDTTANRIGRFTDQRIRYYEQPHAGILALAQTYNRALSLASGDLIAILEGDDFWPPDKLATLVPALADPAIILAFGKTVETTANGSPTGYTIPEPAFVREFGDAALLNAPVGVATKAMFLKPAMTYTFPCSVVIRRSALETIGGFQHIEGIPFVDYQTFLTLSLVGRYFYTPKVMGFWRRHGRSATALRYQDVTEARLLAFMRTFLQTHRTRMALTPREEETIAATLLDWERRIALYHGLAVLHKGRWAEARSRFRTALKSRQPTIRLGGAVGVVATYLHIELDWLVEVHARLFDRQMRTTGLKRRLSGETEAAQDSTETR